MNLSPILIPRPSTPAFPTTRFNSKIADTATATRTLLPPTVLFGNESVIPDFDPVPGYRKALETVPGESSFRQDAVRQLLETMIIAGEHADKTSSVPPVRAFFVGHPLTVEAIAHESGRPLIHVELGQIHDWDIKKLTEFYERGGHSQDISPSLAERVNFANLSACKPGQPRPILLLSNIEDARGSNGQVIQLLSRILKEGKMALKNGEDLDFKGIDVIVSTKMDTKLGLSRLTGKEFVSHFNAEGASGQSIRTGLRDLLDSQLNVLKTLFRFPVTIDAGVKARIVDSAFEDGENSDKHAIVQALRKILREPLANIAMGLVMHQDKGLPTQVDLTYEEPKEMMAEGKIKTEYHFQSPVVAAWSPETN